MPQRSHPQLPTSYDRVGLVLTWTQTQGLAMVLQMIFGITQSSLSNYLTFCTYILIHVLQQMEDAKIKRPNAEKVMEYHDALQHHHLLLSEVWCNMDGLQLMLECSSDKDEQTDSTMAGHVTTILVLSSFFVQMVLFPSVAIIFWAQFMTATLP
jgi:hypothetical protein